MRTILGLNLVCLLAISALAQDRNFPAALGAGLPPMRSFGQSFGPPARPHRSGFPAGAGYGYGFGGYGYAAPYPEIAPVVNNVVLVQQPTLPAAPPEPIHSSVQNVKGYPGQSAADADALPAFFVIVLKNGSHLTAAMVWVQGDDARYVDGDGQGHRVPLADVNRTATREMNQSHHLNLRLPPPAQ
jgi:hypothetical protein